MNRYQPLSKIFVAVFFMLTTACGGVGQNATDIAHLSLPQDHSENTFAAPPDAANGQIAAEMAQQKVQVDLETLAEQGTPADTTSTISIKSGGVFKPTPVAPVRLKKGSRLLALVDTACASRQDDGLSNEVSAGRDRTLNEQAYAFSLNQDMDLAELDERASNDNCVLKIGNDDIMHAVSAESPKVTTLAAEPPKATTLSVPNDPQYSQQWHLQDIEAAAGYDTFYGANGINSDVVIAIVDTGVNYNHVDLKANMWKGPNGTPGTDLVNRDSDPMDDMGHGTHCAGLAAGVSNNGVGISGVMGQHSKIMAVKVLGSDGSGSVETIVNGVNWAAQNGANIISLSLGAKGQNSVFGQAVSNAVSRGVTVVMAAGNDNTKMSSSVWYSPASYAKALNGAIAVGSIMSNNQRSQFSNYSPDYVDIGSPGSDILSTLKDGTYGKMSGTSMATPITAGAAALIYGLLKARGVSPTPALIESLLLDGSIKDQNLASYFKNGNRLNLHTLAALINQKYPAAGPQPTPTPTPLPTPTPIPGPTPSPTPTPVPIPTPVPTPMPTPIPTPGPTPFPSDCGSASGAACDLIHAVNQARSHFRIPQLEPMSNCNRLAQDHADDMAMGQFISHVSPRYGSFPQRAQAHGLIAFAAENIARGGTVNQVIQAWANDRNSAITLVDNRMHSVGAGFAVDQQGRPYYVLCLSAEPGH